MLPVLKNALGDITGLLGFITDADKGWPLARGPLGPQIFREPLVRQLNDRIGCRQNGLRGIETIVFSTRLTRITPYLRRRNIDAALQLVSDTVQDWSGGTKIGACLQEFNATMAANMVTSKTLVIIISDGWDTGDTAVLDTAMARLRRIALRVIWLNPLLGSANYQPLCKGIQTALPYVHDFLPVHNVESLRQFGHLVASLI